MSPSGEDRSRLERFEALGDQIEAAEHLDAARRAQRARRRPRHDVRVRVAVGVLACLAILLVVVALPGAPRARAAPDQAAAAADKAGTFSFSVRSQLLAGSAVIRESLTRGEVDLPRQAVRSTVMQRGAGAGFERIVFPSAVYVRQIAGRASRVWVASRLQPPAMIDVSAGSGGGLGDPLGLLAVLARVHSARFVGSGRIDGVAARAYTVRTTVGTLAAIEGERLTGAPAAVPVTIDTWQDHAGRLLLAIRTFWLPHGQRLRITSRFAHYGRPTAIARPGVIPVGSQTLNPFADDPVGVSILAALKAGRANTAADSVRTR